MEIKKQSDFVLCFVGNELSMGFRFAERCHVGFFKEDFDLKLV